MTSQEIVSRWQTYTRIAQTVATIIAAIFIILRIEILWMQAVAFCTIIPALLGGIEGTFRSCVKAFHPDQNTWDN